MNTNQNNSINSKNNSNNNSSKLHFLKSYSGLHQILHCDPHPRHCLGCWRSGSGLRVQVHMTFPYLHAKQPKMISWGWETFGLGPAGTLHSWALKDRIPKYIFLQSNKSTVQAGKKELAPIDYRHSMHSQESSTQRNTSFL